MQSVCVRVCVCLRRLLALLIVHRWVFAVRKGEFERKWWTPCVQSLLWIERSWCAVVLRDGSTGVAVAVFIYIHASSECTPTRVCVLVSASQSCCLSKNKRGQPCCAPGEWFQANTATLHCWLKEELERGTGGIQKTHICKFAYMSKSSHVYFLYFPNQIRISPQGQCEILSHTHSAAHVVAWPLQMMSSNNCSCCSLAKPFSWVFFGEFLTKVSFVPFSSTAQWESLLLVICRLAEQ